MTHSVLVVDDEPSMSFVLEHLMKAQGYDVKTAPDGNTAVSHAQKHHPDVVLLDLSRDDRNAHETCQIIRSSAETCDIKIIMISARGREIEIEKGLAVGADTYLTKPFAIDTVVTAVKSLLTNSKAEVAFA